jgi:hypothetical protein
MKIRQTYICGNDSITVRYTTNNINLIIDLEEVSRDEQAINEVVMPNLNVTSEQFNLIINNYKLK